MTKTVIKSNLLLSLIFICTNVLDGFYPLHSIMY